MHPAIIMSHQDSPCGWQEFISPWMS